MIPTVNFTLSVATLGAQIFLLWVFVYFFLYPKHAKKNIAKYLTPEIAIRSAFGVALLATSGSLFYSEVAKFVPCELCWFQRILMYPQVILLGLAVLKKDTKIIDYSLSLASAGIIISLYQNYLVYISSQSATCSLSGESCAIKFVLGLGYVTIPLMALTAFALIITILLSQKIKNA